MTVPGPIICDGGRPFFLVGEQPDDQLWDGGVDQILIGPRCAKLAHDILMPAVDPNGDAFMHLGGVEYPSSYFRRFARATLLGPGDWHAGLAAVNAATVVRAARGRPLILLGMRVAAAFQVIAGDWDPWRPWGTIGQVGLPSPTTISMAVAIHSPNWHMYWWGKSAMTDRARRAVADLVRVGTAVQR